MAGQSILGEKISQTGNDYRMLADRYYQQIKIIVSMLARPTFFHLILKARRDEEKPL
jgi:hypothetical protein